MTIFIYKISFPLELSTKVYIGQTKDPIKRQWQHKNNAKNKHNNAIYRAMRKYGIENTIFEVIATVLNEEYANESEIYLIHQYDSFNNGYNETLGGYGGGMMGKKHSKETKKKIRISQEGKNGNCYGKFGKYHSRSNLWKLYFQDGRIEVKDNLCQWAKQNGYSDGKISNVYHQKRKKHKDIIRVEKLD